MSRDLLRATWSDIMRRTCSRKACRLTMISDDEVLADDDGKRVRFKLTYN